MIIQCFGKKKNAIAITTAKKGSGKIKINGVPINLVHPLDIKNKILEPFFILGSNERLNLNFDIFSKGGGKVSQIYAIRQSISKCLVFYYYKYISASKSNLLKIKYLTYDKKLLISDVSRIEPKKYGGLGARARFQKSYR
ncbi:ribosomal protein S16 (nucleomorph) [Bigelowiella natans]|uniref:Ribosomal protein S16 n=1 Tax=Bigelowiella natans TaxID=227086 RepID=Q3LWA6_BIGNA|nr:ribosomal protein S16 [Bigelowiella natans]ABA27260.1 ribosomal protein S16 [Bigelowiella natans]|mmetsp:Transcript_1126/g.1817  ORF Transcript_1126/g.1817 Transcript_1126/m.1817 type:complete len:140 (+) Transcript_1126:851-1270(+)